eukprot:TRINITY_DN3997_c0_g1_i2.p1 TRINITY_DN3997_c0_g1~~TRINITY_DN3997_c0_g1_i2.p1  ORF type:complete len:651 (+),score=108.50 TRINITY_DN3997_c0_g1_i2:329-2281(+)
MLISFLLSLLLQAYQISGRDLNQYSQSWIGSSILQGPTEIIESQRKAAQMSQSSSTSSQTLISESESPSSLQKSYVIITLKQQEHLTKIKAICSESTYFYQQAADKYGWEGDKCHMPGACIHIYEHAVWGAYAHLSWLDLVAITSDCLKDELGFFEIDGSVKKAEGQQQVLLRRQLKQDGGVKFPWVNLVSLFQVGSGDQVLNNTSGEQNETEQLSVKNELNSQQSNNANTGYVKVQKSKYVFNSNSSQVSSQQKQTMDHVGHIAADYITNKLYDADNTQLTTSSNSISNSNPSVTPTSNTTSAIPVGYKIQNIPDAFWNLDRVDQRHLPLDGLYVYGGSNVQGTGRGVTIYVIDSGIRTSHQEFLDRDQIQYRATVGADFVDMDGDGSDCDGHGTHVASTAVGRAVGMAKDAHVVGVRVLDCYGNGQVGNVIAGIDWVLGNLQTPAVATLSLGIMDGEGSSALQLAVQTMIKDYDVTTVVASGNLAIDSCLVVPANIPETITVAASDLPTKYGRTSYLDDETMYTLSNTGECVDIFAPGVGIYAACGGLGRCEDVHDAAYTWADGTSMAVPHVAATVAMFLGEVPLAKPADVKAALLAIASVDKIKDIYMISTTPNRLLHSNLEAMMKFYNENLVQSGGDFKQYYDVGG